MGGHAIISGGSVAGLFAAAALRTAGWSVDVYERTAVELSGRGAGIVTHPQLIAALTRVGADISDLGVETHQRAVFDKVGQVVETMDFEQVVTSWNRIHHMLRAMLPDECHHLGRMITGYRQDDRAIAVFEDGSHAEADLLIGADGFRSAIRAQMLPDIRPEYSGYLVWRALVDEADLPLKTKAQVFERFSFFIPNGQQIIGYPIAGEGNDLRPGHRRYNFVWYTPADAAMLDDMLTDAEGQRHSLTISPPLVRDDVIQRMRDLAARVLPPPFVEILDRSERPFFTPIYDHLSPTMADGRIALAGDAACVARPHVGMGVTKAAEDALALADNLGSRPVPEALAAYSAQRVPAARAAFERSRWLGGCIFEAPASGDNSDGRSNPNIDAIMRLTAIADF